MTPEPCRMVSQHCTPSRVYRSLKSSNTRNRWFSAGSHAAWYWQVSGPDERLRAPASSRTQSISPEQCQEFWLRLDLNFLEWGLLMFLRYSIRLSWSILFWTHTWRDLSTHACCSASWGRFFPSGTSIQLLNFLSYTNRWSWLRQPLLKLVVYHHIQSLWNLYLRFYGSALSISYLWLIWRCFALYFFFFSNKFIEYMEKNISSLFSGH